MATVAGAVLLAASSSAAYLLPPTTGNRGAVQPVTRREALVGVASFSAANLFAATAQASGGATAGKTTSIPRAKLRYYGRVTAVVIAYEALGAAIKSGDGIKAAASSFFSDSEEGPAQELKTAGYLLSVAFKIDGKIPPDKIQQVKDDLDTAKGSLLGDSQFEIQIRT